MKKIVFVTGAGKGIGQITALQLAKSGYTVCASARTLADLEHTKQLSLGAIRIATVDTTNMAAIKDWVGSEISNTQNTPWGFVANAGSYGAIGAVLDIDMNEWEAGLNLNLMAPVRCSQFFAQLLVSRKIPGRIVLLSGGGATQPLPHFTNYCAAKAGVVRFGETLALELKPHGITVNSIAPGAINSGFIDQVLKAGPKLVGEFMYEKTLKQKESGGTDPQHAAQTIDFLMSDSASHVTGLLISAVWDKWKEFPENWAEIEKTDWYRLRRIVPPGK